MALRSTVPGRPLPLPLRNCPGSPRRRKRFSLHVTGLYGRTPPSTGPALGRETRRPMCPWRRRHDRSTKSSLIRPAGNHLSATALRPGLFAISRVGCPLPRGSTAVHRHGDPLSPHAEPAHDVLLCPAVLGSATFQVSDANRSIDARFCGRLPTARLAEAPGTRSPSRIFTDSAPLRRTVPDADHPTGATGTPLVPQLTDGPNSGRIPTGPPARDPMQKAAAFFLGVRDHHIPVRRLAA